MLIVINFNHTFYNVMKKINDIYLIKETDGCIILINTKDNNEIYKFDGVSKVIIENIGLEKQKIIDKICSKFSVSSSIISIDYDNFINELLNLNILVNEYEK